MSVVESQMSAGREKERTDTKYRLLVNDQKRGLTTLKLMKDKGQEST